MREYPNLNKPFLDSIAERGVVVPLTAIRHHDGAVEVRDGQRRTMAARKLRLSTVPVYLLPATAADTTAETIAASCTRWSPTTTSVISPTLSVREGSSR